MTKYVWKLHPQDSPLPNPVEHTKEGCPNPKCDALDHQDGTHCPFICGNCWWCGLSDCDNSTDKCDGLTYDERNKGKS